MLLTFPVNPPASQKAETLQIISESVYENSSTLDGRRFAQEFYDKRRNDAIARAAAGFGAGGGGAAAARFGVAGTPSSSLLSGLGGANKSSLADVVKAVPKPSADLGFKIVKAKGKKKQ